VAFTKPWAEGSCAAGASEAGPHKTGFHIDIKMEKVQRAHQKAEAGNGIFGVTCFFILVMDSVQNELLRPLG
jgi:hypothetical protein